MMPEKQYDKVTRLADPFNKERERMHRQMMSSVSHDLKTPLASIIGSLEIHDQMKDQLDPEKKQILLDTALQEAYRLDNFITNILDMAKLENDQVKVKRELCDIGGLLQSCMGQPIIAFEEDSDVTLCAVSGILTATTDPTLLQRTVGLLLDNAVKYGGVPSGHRYRIWQKSLRRILYQDTRSWSRRSGAQQSEAIFSKYAQRFCKTGYAKRRYGTRAFHLPGDYAVLSGRQRAGGQPSRRRSRSLPCNSRWQDKIFLLYCFLTSSLVIPNAFLRFLWAYPYRKSLGA